MYTTRTLESPLGCLTLIASATGVARLLWESEKNQRVQFASGNPSRTGRIILDKAEQQIVRYFSGKPITPNVPIDLAGTPFQMRVWQKLLLIPWGATLTYGDLAGMLGDVKMARAVGTALGKNPVPILIPCHRVLGGLGKLGGFSGGIFKKRYLLELERILK